MKNFLKKAGKALWVLLNSKIFYFVIIVLLVLFGLNKCGNEHNLQAENTILQQNISAKNDTIKTYKTKNGDLIAEKEVFILSEKELKKENADLYRRIKEQDGSIISMNRTIISLKQDSAMLNDSIRTLHKIIGEAVKIDSNTWMIPWELQYNWDSTNFDVFKGRSFVSVSNKDPLTLKHDNTLMYFRNTQIDIEFGNKVVDDKYNVFIKSAYPGFTPESMVGVFIDPNTNKDIQKLLKKDHWFTGFSLAISATVGYDVIYQRPTIVVGPSLNYNIYSW